MKILLNTEKVNQGLMSIIIVSLLKSKMLPLNLQINQIDRNLLFFIIINFFSLLLKVNASLSRPLLFVCDSVVILIFIFPSACLLIDYINPSCPCYYAPAFSFFRFRFTVPTLHGIIMNPILILTHQTKL